MRSIKKASSSCYSLFLLLFAKLILAYAAHWAGKIIRKRFELGAGGDAVVGITDRFVIHPAANVAYIFHVLSPHV